MKSADYLHNIVNIIENSPKFLNYVFTKKSKIVENIDNIYVSIPEEVKEMRVNDKTFEGNVRIFDLLRTLELCIEEASISLFFSEYTIFKINEVESIISRLAECLPEYDKITS